MTIPEFCARVKEFYRVDISADDYATLQATISRGLAEQVELRPDGRRVWAVRLAGLRYPILVLCNEGGMIRPLDWSAYKRGADGRWRSAIARPASKDDQRA